MCGQLRTDKVDDFVEMMEGCRQYSPDLIVLNHRLKLGKGMPYTTTFLWEGQETYIDVFTSNRMTAPHNRARCINERTSSGNEEIGGRLWSLSFFLSGLLG